MAKNKPQGKKRPTLAEAFNSQDEQWFADNAKPGKKRRGLAGRSSRKLGKEAAGSGASGLAARVGGGLRRTAGGLQRLAGRGVSALVGDDQLKGTAPYIPGVAPALSWLETLNTVDAEVDAAIQAGDAARAQRILQDSGMAGAEMERPEVAEFMESAFPGSVAAFIENQAANDPTGYDSFIPAGLGIESKDQPRMGGPLSKQALHEQDIARIKAEYAARRRAGGDRFGLTDENLEMLELARSTPTGGYPAAPPPGQSRVPIAPDGRSAGTYDGALDRGRAFSDSRRGEIAGQNMDPDLPWVSDFTDQRRQVGPAFGTPEGKAQPLEGGSGVFRGGGKRWSPGDSFGAAGKPQNAATYQRDVGRPGGISDGMFAAQRAARAMHMLNVGRPNLLTETGSTHSPGGLSQRDRFDRNRTQYSHSYDSKSGLRPMG